MGKLKLLVFDLDYTLWPFWVDSVGCPIRKDKNNKIVDGYGSKLKYFPEVPEVLKKLKNEGYLLGVASRTDCPKEAKKLLELFDWNKYFTYKEIYPGRKTTHFQRIQKESGISYSEMIFFDDEQRNISDLESIGVKSILVSDGVNKRLIEEALKEFDQKS